MTARSLRLSVSDGVAQIVIDRVHKKNAMSLEMWREMARLVSVAAADRSVLVVVLRGTDGTAFASGADIEEMMSIAGDSDAWTLMDAVRGAEQALSDCPKPVIAMIRGVCIGGGVELALGCDLRFAARTATFAVPPAKLGLVYSLSSTRRLIELVGLGRARDLLYSARSFDASEALRIGLVERVFEDDEIERKTMEYVEVLARRSQYSIRAAKKVSAAAMRGGSDEDEDIREIRGGAFSGDDLAEGLSAFASKRPPDFGWR
jgi:enoyl-CoA hydratase/carnithine racemase